jgi:hypothetical protein
MSKFPKDKINTMQVQRIKDKKYNLPDDLLTGKETREEMAEKIITHIRERKMKPAKVMEELPYSDKDALAGITTMVAKVGIKIVDAWNGLTGG